MQSDHSALGKAVKLARQRKNLSQETLAEILDITPTHLKHIESGHRNPSVDLLFRMARALQMSLDDVIFPERQLPSLNFQKAQLLLRDCDEQQLNVIVATLGAMNPPEKYSKENN
jgi:transcriptional regulator with XRE-family HTH domain